MHILLSDLEGVFVPEIWINVAEKTGIEEFRFTTRDVPDYHVLMKRRISTLQRHNLKLRDIQAVIAKIDPLEGAEEMLDWIREHHQIIIVSDTFVQFAGPLMKKLGRPPLFCNELVVAPDGTVTDFRLRQPDGKRRTALALQELNYRVIAFGDSYNDISMLKQADTAFLFRPPDNVIEEFPELPVFRTYIELKNAIIEATAHVV